MGLPMGIEPIPPELNSGVLSRLNYGVIQNYDGQVVPQDGDLQSGTRTRPEFSSGRSLMASDLPLAWRITCNFRPIEIGVTNRIRTGTNAFTGRDAAVTS